MRDKRRGEYDEREIIRGKWVSEGGINMRRRVRRGRGDEEESESMPLSPSGCSGCMTWHSPAKELHLRQDLLQVVTHVVNAP